jgi:hypothetical protein
LQEVAPGTRRMLYISTAMSPKPRLLQRTVSAGSCARSERHPNQQVLSMIKQPLKALILIFLWGALLEDTIIFLMSWLAPDVWFRLFHNAVPASLDVAFLRRSGGQWAAFAIAQAIALWRWRKQPVWLPIVAGVRFSDLFTDVSYILAVPSLTTLGWCVLIPLPFLNFIGVVIMLRGYRQARAPASQAGAEPRSTV